MTFYNKFLAVGITTAIIVGGSAVALAKPVKPAPVVVKPVYCGTSPYDVSYAAIFEYPTGSYWVKQIAAYPDYYAANNAYYQSHFGC